MSAHRWLVVAVPGANALALWLASLLPGSSLRVDAATLLLGSAGLAGFNALAQVGADRFFDVWLGFAQFDPSKRLRLAIGILARLLFVPSIAIYWLRNAALLYYGVPLLLGGSGPGPIFALTGGWLLNLANWRSLRELIGTAFSPAPNADRRDGEQIPAVGDPDAVALFAALRQPRPLIQVLDTAAAFELRARVAFEEFADHILSHGYQSESWPGAAQWSEVETLVCELARAVNRPTADPAAAALVARLKALRFRLTAERRAWHQRHGPPSYEGVEIDVIAEGPLASVAAELEKGDASRSRAR